MTHLYAPLPPQNDLNRYDTQAIIRTKPPVSFGTTYSKIMRAQVNEPTSVAEENQMKPPSGYPQPIEKAPSDSFTKRRESRFDPMGHEFDEEEGYGELSHRHPSRQAKEDEPKTGGSFSLPGIKSLLNPSFERDTVATSASYGQSPSLPSLISSNSPSGSPSTLRTSRYSSLASGSSISAESQGWWAPEFERDRSQATASRSRHVLPALYIDEQEGKRRRSDQPRSTHEMDEQARMKWMAQPRNASFPTASSIEGTSTHSSPTMGSMNPPAHPTAAMSRQSRSQQDPTYHDRRPSAVPRTLSSVSGTLTSSFAELSSNERDRERDRQRSASHPHDMPPPFPSPLGMDRERRFSALQSNNPGEYHSHNHLTSSPVEIQRMRHHTATPPEPYRASSYSSETEPVRPNIQRTARSSLSEMIMAQSGDDRSMSQGRLGVPQHMESHGHGYGGWHPTRRSSGSSTHSTSTPGVSVNLNSEDGHTPIAQHRREFRDERERPSNPMGGMDVLAESARRVSEEETRRGGGTIMDDRDREDSPKGGGGPGGPKYQCAYCTKTFSRPSSLRIHTYSHTGERPFICQEPSCGRRFSVQSNLKRHAKVHQLGQAGGASLHQLHNGPVPLRGPGPGQGHGVPPPQQHGYYSHHPQVQSQGQQHQGPRGYGYDNSYPPQPYPQPQPHPQPRGAPEHRYSHGPGAGREWNDVEEDDELDDEDEEMEE